MKLSSTQYFILLALALAILTALTVLKLVDVSILVGILLGILGVGAHISGVNTGVPLQAPATILPATLETTTPPAEASHAQVPG